MKCFKITLVVMLLLLPTLVWAKGPGGVANGPHNLSATGVFINWAGIAVASPYASDEDEICVFCHTPHGGSLTGPLWNRSDPNPAVWKHYNSATLTLDRDATALSAAPNAESLLCLSCHDGSISVYHVINPPNDRNGVAIKTSGTGTEDVTIVDAFNFGTGARTGGSLADTEATGDLSDDHPISFSYNDVFAAYNLGPKSGELIDPALAEAGGDGVRFFGPNNNVECSSCHDPHVNYVDNPAYTPFLIMSNSGSAMCLACHNK